MYLDNPRFEKRLNSSNIPPLTTVDQTWWITATNVLVPCEAAQCNLTPVIVDTDPQ